MKKVRGEGAPEYYSNWIDPITGEIKEVKPEYATMSRKPGIGKPWFDKYKEDVFPNDYCIVRGHEVRPPRYYETLLSEEELQEVKEKRKKDAPEVYDQYDERMDRLWVSQIVKEEALKRLIRDL